MGYVKGYHITKPRLLKLLPEIIEVVDVAIRIADAAPEQTTIEPLAAGQA